MTNNKKRNLINYLTSQLINHKGFTLLEVVVVLAIFSVLTLAVSNIFIYSSRSQQKAKAIQNLEAQSRFILETIVNRVKTRGLDYDYYDGQPIPAPPLTEISLKQDGEYVLIKKSEALDETACPDQDSRPCLLMVANQGIASLTPKGVILKDLKFYPAPAENPFSQNPLTGEYTGPNEQPHLTISMTLETVGEKMQEKAELTLQTTIASREYQR